jgi:hypothetical protein
VYNAELPASFSLEKDGIAAEVDLVQATIEVSIGTEIDAGGMSPFTVTEGSGQFDAYLFDSEPIGISNFEVLEGDGEIHWETGEATGRILVRTTALGFLPITARATGFGNVNLATGDVTLNLNSLASQISSLPALNGLSIVLLIVALGAAGRMVYRRMDRVSHE